MSPIQLLLDQSRYKVSQGQNYQRLISQKMPSSDYSLVLMVIISTAITAEERVPIKVIRHSDYDTVVYYDGQEDCEQNSSTYVVDERSCESNQELLNGNAYTCQLYSIV